MMMMMRRKRRRMKISLSPKHAYRLQGPPNPFSVGVGVSLYEDKTAEA
jgi:hypothetical protein